MLEAYSVLIDAKTRAAYDLGFSASHATADYAGYEHATPEQDQQEAADWFQRVLNETPTEFVRTTLLLLIFCPVTLIVWLGTTAIAYLIFEIFAGRSTLGWGGQILLILMFFPNLLVSVFGAFALKDLYYRAKHILMWIKIRARMRRMFARLFGRKPGRSLKPADR